MLSKKTYVKIENRKSDEERNLLTERSNLKREIRDKHGEERYRLIGTLKRTNEMIYTIKYNEREKKNKGREKVEGKGREKNARESEMEIERARKMDRERRKKREKET